MSSSSGEEQTLTSPNKQQANAPEATAMDAKLIVATGNGDVQLLKDPVKKQESEMMTVVMAKQAAPADKPHRGNMDPHLLALASSGSYQKLGDLLNEGVISRPVLLGVSITGRASRYDYGDIEIESYGYGRHIYIEANESILEGVTAEGDTALHVVAAGGHGGNDDNFKESARTIYRKAKHILFVQNNNGDTPLHCAARAGKSSMVGCLIDLAFTEGEDRVKELLRQGNKHNETALHEAIRIGNKDIVDLLMFKDSELASIPKDGGTSPMYLAIMLRQKEIVDTLHDKSHGNLSFSGPNGQNALHAAALRHQVFITALLKWNKIYLWWQNKDLTTQRDENGSTPLHFAAAINIPFGPSRVYRQVLEAVVKSRFGLSRVCRQVLEAYIKSRFWPSICEQVLEANPVALYQQDHEGFSPLHVAASVGAIRNVEMFVKKCPGSAGLRDAKGRTFLHVAVEKKQVEVIRSACRNLSLSSWIMNMVDNDGNTALHLAVKAGSLRMFCSLLRNPQVKLNLPNNRGETPSNIAQYKIRLKGGFYSFKSSEAQILLTLANVGADIGVCRVDHLIDALRVNLYDESKETMEVVKDSAGAMCIGSVLIATVTFGATFAMPGGYIADDHRNGGSPILSPRYAFDAFIASNTLAFVFSTMATISLMKSGNPVYNTVSRKAQLITASYLVSFSITCLAAAFALAAYAVLAPVAHKTAVATCVLASLVMLYRNIAFIGRRLLLLSPLHKRKGFILTWVYSAYAIMLVMLIEYWPLIFIFGWAAHANPRRKIGAVAQAPPPLA